MQNCGMISKYEFTELCDMKSAYILQIEWHGIHENESNR